MARILVLISLSLFGKGFETRGTRNSDRSTACSNLLKETKPSGPLTSNPFERLPEYKTVNFV